MNHPRHKDILPIGTLTTTGTAGATESNSSKKTTSPSGGAAAAAIASTVEERVRHWRTMIPAKPIGRGYKEFKAAVDLVEELGELLQGLDVIG